MMSFESLHLVLILWFAGVLLLAGMLQGALGFGFPFVATPLIAMVTDLRTAIMLEPCDKRMVTADGAEKENGRRSAGAVFACADRAR